MWYPEKSTRTETYGGLLRTWAQVWCNQFNPIPRTSQVWYGPPRWKMYFIEPLNKVTPPAATPRHFTFFPACHFWLLQPFQGFVSFASWRDLQIHWYLQDFDVVFMNLQWSKQLILGLHCFKKPTCLFFHLQVFANLPSSFNLASLATLFLHTKLYM